MRKKIICLCNLVSEKEIEEFLEKGAETVSDIQRLTNAGSTCGRCLTEIEACVRKHAETKRADAQTKIKFG